MPFFWTPPPPLPPPPPAAVSYQREVAPIFAMHCNSCHGEAAGLNMRTYASLMAGGNIGKVIIAGNAEGSALFQSIDGRRVKTRRMPMGSPPLPAAAIDTIRRWIDEGATSDPPIQPDRILDVARKLPPGSVLRVSCKTPVEAYLLLRVRHSKSRKVLFERAGAVKNDAREQDAGKPKQLIRWEVRPEPGWPEKLDVELSLQYPRGRLDGAELDATVEKAPRP